MPDNKGKAGAPQDTGSQQTHRDEGLDLTVPRPGDNLADRRVGHGIGWHPDRQVWCSAGCEPGEHTCGVGEPIGEPVDWDESAVGYATADGTAITSLRRHSEKGRAA